MNNTHSYVTRRGVKISRSTTKIPIDTATDELCALLDSQRGVLLASSYEYPGRYKRWDIGFVNPPLELATHGNSFTITALNERGQILLPYVAECLSEKEQINELESEGARIKGSIKSAEHFFTEEERSKQPSVFTVIREIQNAFHSTEDEHLGLYGAFGYDLVFQFEPIKRLHERSADQRDLVLYLPDELVVVDHHLQSAFRFSYDYETRYGRTSGLLRTGEVIDFKGACRPPAADSDHAPGEYQDQVRKAVEYFRRGGLFEVVPSQSFYRACEESPTRLFRILRRLNPSPYGFLFNLGGEYLIGASPEMFVRVKGRRVETCPISGTTKRGQNAIEDAERIRQLLNSGKDEAELTMCTDVDRNDKSRICEPASVRVIGRRQIETYSHLIHTVDHVEGTLRPEFDALDAFLTHTWAVTVTGAPKRAAMQFIEEHEHSPRRWYGGAVGRLTFDGNLDTGLILRTMRLKDSVAEVRVGATLLYDSIPEAEEQETFTKAAALFQTLQQARQHDTDLLPNTSGPNEKIRRSGRGKRVILVDYEDSFVHTLANYIRQTGATVITLRHGFPDTVLDTERPDLVVLSPGPGRPSDFCVAEMVTACARRRIPVVGVCLGFQGIIETYGGELGVLDYPMHGKSSRVLVKDVESHTFKGLPTSFEVGRYHSLYALPDRLPQELKVTAVSDDGVIMGIEHRTLPIAAIQFHPESIMSLAGDVGLSIVANLIHSFTKEQEDQLTTRGMATTAQVERGDGNQARGIGSAYGSAKR